MFNQRTPIHRRIADQIKGDILSGTLAEDEQVMSTLNYAAHCGINPAIAARSLQELVDEGILYKYK